ncbi:glycoside hydrolase family 10 [Spirochaeta thermophila DSM 6578]|uniref:endo-1,4-beta-xylanase n=1 Tax=Winmispira thermophila (strain ATCC 700085 / DSM 6578 / Z-1203) TaxID=869211 RepID=G0GD23_WINT7|nr:endo-1,4-beta-xylanase [Spirochaeta thermophila]AEJ62098.1 glycoside hydrolase family 10 [Spirochaeta thermophila DSM 6578]
MSTWMRGLFVLFVAVLLASCWYEVTPRVEVNTGSKFLGNIFYGAEEPLKFSQYWNQVTPENAGKWGSVESSRDQMNWGTLDSIYDYAKQHGMPFKFHVLVWGQQQPSWISGLSASEQRAEVEEWFAAVANRYADIDMIDVVNEPLHSPPPYRDALGGDGSTGWDWVVTSFQLAREYFPNSTLLINEYGIISDPSAAQRYIQIIDLLKARGLVDGIGIQCHAFNMDSVSVSTMEQVLDMLAQTGLPIYVSELDMRGDDQTQLQRYQEKFPVLWEHPSVRGVTLWGYVEGHIWQSEAYLLHSDGTERPALTWLMQYASGGSTPTPTPTPTSTPTPTPTATSSPTPTPTPGSGEYTEINLPFSYDGAGEYYWKTNDFSSTTNWGRYVNSWNLDLLEINGTDYTNTWVPQHAIPASSDGCWYIHYESSVPWGHVEMN